MEMNFDKRSHAYDMMPVALYTAVGRGIRVSTVVDDDGEGSREIGDVRTDGGVVSAEDDSRRCSCCRRGSFGEE